MYGTYRTLARRSAGFTCLLALTAVTAAASPVPAPPAGPPIVGTVQDAGGTPLPNAQVIVAELGRVTTTNAAGAFAVRGLPAGVYHLNVQLIGYAPAHVVVTVPDSGDAVHVTIPLRPATVRLQGVQVTATPTGTDPLNITQSTVELSGKELARNVGASIAQTLSNEPGIAMRYNGPTANVPVIRGLTGERILVLQDGERAGDLSSTANDHGLSVDPLNAQRIEVVRGPASLLYGNNALGGVVNVISNDIPTEVPSHVEGHVGAQAESVNPGGAASMGLTVPLGHSLAITARGGYRDIGDVRFGGGGILGGTDSRNHNVTLGLGYIGERVTGGFAYRGFDFDYGLPSAPDAEEQGVRIDGRRHQLSGRTSVDLGDNALTYLRLDGTAQWYGHDEVEPSGAIGTEFRLRTQTVNATAKTRLGRLSGAVGLQGLFRQYEAAGEEALTPGANSDNGAIFVYQELALGAGRDEANTPRLQFGGRYDLFRLTTQTNNAKFGAARALDFDNASGSLGVSLPLGRDASISASAARAFRAPTVEELFSEGVHHAAGSYDRGSPDLEAETNSGLDAVLRVQSGRTFAQLSAYYNQIDDYIYPALRKDTLVAGEEAGETEELPLVQYAQRDASLRGIEAQVEYEVMPSVVLGVMGDLVRGRFDGGDALPFMPAARIGGSARWEAGRLSIGADARRAFEQRRVSQPTCEPSVRCVDIPTPAYTMLGVNVGYTLVGGAFAHSITLRADNLLDERYFDATSRIKSFAPSPGRNVALVYKVLF